MKEFIISYWSEILSVLFGFLIYLRTGKISKNTKKEQKIVENVSQAPVIDNELEKLIDYHKKAVQRLEAKKNNSMEDIEK